MLHARERAIEKILNGLATVDHAHVVHQVDGPRISERGVLGDVTLADQVRGPEMAGAPGNRAVQQDFAVRGFDRNPKGEQAATPKGFLAMRAAPKE